MGAITEAIEKLIAEYVRDWGLVLWFDPERHYESIAQGMNAGQERVLVFNGSFYKLRLEAESRIRGFDRPKLLVYLPITWEQAEHPLAEMLALGVDLRPGVSGNRNTRLAVVARRALKGRVPDARLDDLDRQIEQGDLTLSELEELSAQGAAGPLPTALTVHFGTSVVDEAALEFLARPERDAELAARNGVQDWQQALSTHFGFSSVAKSPAEIRAQLARYVLTCDLLETLGSDTPESFQRVLPSDDPVVVRRAAAVAREWRNRRDVAASYPGVASAVARSLHLESLELTDAALERAGTFLSLEQRLLRRVATRVIVDPDAASIAQSRMHAFWAEQDPELQAEWALAWQAGQLLARAAEIEKLIQAREYSWLELVEQYTGAANWAQLDTLHRRLERRASSLEFALASPAEEVDQLVHAVRRRHQEVSGGLAETFLRAWRAESFSIGGHLRQTEIFERHVAPEIAKHRTAYILVDALRWELARELPDVLGSDFETQIALAIGTAPSITEIGMAALLPSAASGLAIAGAGKLQVSIHGQVLKNRADRIAYLKESAGVPVIDLKLEDSKVFRRKAKDLPAGPSLMLVTSREIDQSGEDEMTAAREHMERVLTHLGLVLRKLAEEGVERFIITADHGYLYGEDLAEGDKIDPPGGKTALLHRRVWAGQGGAASASYLLTEISRFGARSDLEMAVPWNLAGFKTPGPTAYFHGGLSPQEILLPVLTVTPKIAGGPKGAKKLTWELSLGSAKITSRFLSARIRGHGQGLFTDSWPNVRVEVRAGAEVCATPVSGSYGFQEATGAVALRSLAAEPTSTEVNTVTLMLTAKAPSRGMVTIHLLDAATGVELKKLENVEVSLAI